MRLFSYPLKLSLGFFFFLAITNYSYGQLTNYSFDSLSSSKYVIKIKSLEKAVVPKMYSEKSAQAWYDEFITDRNTSIIDEFKNDALIHDTLLLSKCNQILNRLANANPKYRFDTIKLYINRSVTANACCYGEGTVMVNLGLFLWVDNDDELALILAHEIAHQFLNHSEQKLGTTIEKLTSDDFKEELKSIKKADYGKYERFKSLMKELIVASGKHSRYKETEADSLGVVMAKNANYNITDAAKVLLKLDYVDDIFTSNKLYNLQEFFSSTAINMTYFTTKSKYNGLSGIKVTMNADKDIDSIKTHPDCKKRYESIMGKITLPNVLCCTSTNNNYSLYKEKALLEIVRHLYEKNALSYCTHLSLFALKNNFKPSFYKNLLSACFSKIYDNDINLKRFNSVNANAEVGSNLKELQDFLFNISSKDIESLAAHFLDENDITTKVDYEFAKMMYNIQVKLKNKETTITQFNSNFPNNKYIYLTKQKQK